MKELLLKDFVFVRHLHFLGLTIVLFPFLMSTVILGHGSFSGLEVTADQVFVMLLHSSRTGTVFSLLPIMLVISYLIAGERSDRTAEFMAYLPPKRSTILLSKFLWIALWISTVAIGYLLIVDIIVPWLSNNDFVDYGDTSRYAMLAVGAFSFGATWLASCVLESPIIAFLLGFAANIILGLATYGISIGFGWPADETTSLWFFVVIRLILGSIFFAAGWVLFIKRVEP